MDNFLDSLKHILNEDCIEKLRVVDPRVHHFSLYVKLKKSDIKKILNIYPDVKIEYSFLKKIKKISIYGRKSFTIYNVTGKKREKLIEKHDKEHKEFLKVIEENHIVF
jgi:hypothetical protein